MDKVYAPQAIERRIYERWESHGWFAPSGRGAPYCIMIPPPNVTGTLHMGHAFQHTLMDALTRYERMRGRHALWQPGTDHAGIATQMVVERQLNAQGVKRTDLGREAFLERVWQWKEQSGGAISAQMRRLGDSVDWSRERFTMDPGLSRAVTEVFVRLHAEGLIYRGTRLVNWDPVLLTALSDLEVQAQEEDGQLWHVRYPLADGAGQLVVATTRPETILGDAAVAVHPEDPRYQELIGRQVLVPLADRAVPVIADAYVDPAFGTGCLKVTPAHDFNDYDIGQRHQLALINIFTPRATLADTVPQRFRGLERFEARKRVVAELQAAGLVERVEKHRLAVPRGDRSGAVLEPYLTDQWYVKIAPLAGPAIAAVEQGRTRFVPENWARTYFEWMRNIKDWCVSRQLWWGHRIPAWYDGDNNIYVGRDEAEVRARHRIGAGVALRQDEDVLDTWFSSALWPFSTLGWPDTTAALERFYPGDVLVTGFDIIFFWVARMIMMGLKFMGDVPFRTVYIHALVRDERGQKMSKSRGNIIDPLDLIDRFGCDALRFTLANLASPGRDIKLAESRVEGSRNFATKLWNAARYAEMSGCTLKPGFDPRQSRLTVNRWIAGATRDCAAAVTSALEDFRFDEAAHRLYHFVWGTFCDWYLEFTKPILQAEDADARAETQATTAWVLAQTVHLLHPIMPFLTEEVWQQLAGARAGMLIIAPWPDLPFDLADPAATAEMEALIEDLSAIRAVRAELNIPPGARIEVEVRDADPAAAARIATHAEHFQRLARVTLKTAAE